jgi:hypothetical protein
VTLAGAKERGSRGYGEGNADYADTAMGTRIYADDADGTTWIRRLWADASTDTNQTLFLLTGDVTLRIVG